MADFAYGNLLTSVSKKIFPNGVAFEVSQRLDSMTVFNGSGGSNLDGLSGNFKGLQSQAMNIFNSVNVNNAEELESACKSADMNVNVSEVDSKYQLDGGNKISAYTFIDKNGNEVTINNANAKEYIQHEREAVDDLITGVINEVASGEITLPDLPEDDLAA